jgi:hypothetical protein
MVFPTSFQVHQVATTFFIININHDRSLLVSFPLISNKKKNSMV